MHPRYGPQTKARAAFWRNGSSWIVRRRWWELRGRAIEAPQLGWLRRVNNNDAVSGPIQQHYSRRSGSSLLSSCETSKDERRWYKMAHLEERVNVARSAKSTKN